MFENVRYRVARWIAGAQKTAVRMYAGARPSRLTFGWGGSTTSADGELKSSLTALRNRSRALIRDAAFAKRAQVLVVNNVIGGGIGMQAQVKQARESDKLYKLVNDEIEWLWWEWKRAEFCHTGGTLHFDDFERAIMAEVFECGEVLIRKHYRAFGNSRVPLSLELIEPERLADELAQPVPGASGRYRMGVEVDAFDRPVAYWIRQRHPGDLRMSISESDRVERVPAEEIIHLRMATRHPQVRGVPWLHAVLGKLNNMDEYTAAELTAARSSASYFATLESDTGDNPLGAQTQDDGSNALDIEAGMIMRTLPGEKLNFHAPNRPNAALDAFMRHMLREVAAGIGVSYESLSRDYSQSNYSSSRLALLDDRDHWMAIQQWYIRSFREPLHREWMRQAVYAGALKGVRVDSYAMDPMRFEAVLFKPKRWSWIDPVKEVNAYKEAVKAGFTTVTDVIATTSSGLDIEDVIETRKRELELFEAAGIEVDTTVAEPMAEVPPAAPPDPEPDEETDDDAEQDDDPQARVVSFRR